MSVSSTVTLLQTLHATITGVTSAPTAYPGTINTAQLPMALTYPEDLEGAQGGAAAPKIVWVYYRVNVYVEAATQGQGVDGPIQDVLTLISRFADAYLDSDNAIQAAGPPQISILSDGDSPVTCDGYQILSYPPGEGGTPYHGFSYRVRIKEFS